MAADPDRPYVGRNAFAHKAGHARRRRRHRCQHLRAPRPGAGRQRPGDPRLRALRQGDGPLAGRAGRASRSTTRPPRGRSSGSRNASTAATTTRRLPPPSSCCCASEAGSYAPLFRLESFRVTTEKRADGRVETEATIKVEVDGERYVRVAEGNGPVNALDRALRAAIVDRHPHLADIELTNYKVRILDESARHRGRHPGSARLLRRRARVGHDRRLGEHHRGLLGGPRRLPRVRLPTAVVSGPAATASRCRWRGPSWASARRSWSSRCCARASSRWGRWESASSAAFAEWLGRRRRGRRLQRHGRPPPRRPGARLGPRRRGADQPVQLRRLRQLPPLRGRRARLLRRRPGHASTSTRRPREAACGERTAGILPVHIFGYPAAMPELEAIAAAAGPRPARGRLRGARGGRRPRAAGSAPAETSPPSPSTRTSR